MSNPIKPLRIFFFLALGLGGGFLAVLVANAPRILSAHPSGSDQAGGLANISLTFSTQMDPACANQHIFISPVASGQTDWEGNRFRFVPDHPWPAGEPVSVRVSAGACPTRGLPLLQDAAFAFTPLPPRIVFLETENGSSTIRAVNSIDLTATDLVVSALPILDFDPSPRGDWIAYSEQSTRGANLWMLDTASGSIRPLLECGNDPCVNPAFSPDGKRLAFQRGELPGAQVSVLNISTGMETAVSSEGNDTAFPVWNPRGWLSYYDAVRHAIVVDDLNGGKTYVPILGGANWSWSADGASLVIPEIVIPAAANDVLNKPESEAAPRIYNHLIRIRTADNLATDLSGHQPWDDVSPSFSPDGGRLAFARQQLGEQYSFGRQLWILNLAAGTARPLPGDEEYNYSAIRWSPDGRLLAFMRFHVTAPLDPPEVWVMGADGSTPRLLAIGASLPHWLP
jgi:Tol biopolymer transport system component